MTAKYLRQNPETRDIVERVNYLINSVDVSLSPLLAYQVDAIGDGDTDVTSVLQDAINDVISTGLYTKVVFPVSTTPHSSGLTLYKFTTLTIPLGITIEGQGGILFNGEINIDTSSGHLNAEHIEFVNLWTKKCTFDLDAAGYASTVRNITFKNCHIDGTNESHLTSSSGNAVRIGERVHDVHFRGTYIHNYTGDAVWFEGDDKVSAAFLATGVFSTFVDCKIYNITGNGIYIDGSCNDGTSLHMTNTLLDHCGIGLKLRNNSPRYSGQGEVTAFLTNCRIELCDMAIHAYRSHIYTLNTWSFGKVSTPYSEVIKLEEYSYGSFHGRITSPNAGVKYPIYADNTCEVFVEGGVTVTTTPANNIRAALNFFPLNYNCRYQTVFFLRFRITIGATAGTIKCKLVKDEGTGIGNLPLTATETGELASGADETIGTDRDYIYYLNSGNVAVGIELPWDITGTWGAHVSRINGSTTKEGSATWNAGTITAGSQATTTITVTGATLGESYRVASFINLLGCTATAYCSATDTVTIVVYNGTGSNQTLSSTTWRVIGEPRIAPVVRSRGYGGNINMALDFYNPITGGTFNLTNWGSAGAYLDVDVAVVTTNTLGEKS